MAIPSKNKSSRANEWLPPIEAFQKTKHSVIEGEHPATLEAAVQADNTEIEKRLHALPLIFLAILVAKRQNGGDRVRIERWL